MVGVTRQYVQISQEIADAICERMAAGESLKQICKSDGMPDRVSVWRHRKANPEFDAKYLAARIEMYENWEDEVLAIADDGTNDYVRRETERGVEVVVDHDHINRSRLRLDTRKWLLSKVLPKKYGDKLEVAGPNGGAIPVSATVTFVKAEPRE